mgnify:CR=1 FL=1
MSKEKRRVPKLRFPGFTEDWEQRKLDNIAKIKTGGGTPKTTNLEYWSGDIPWIQSSDLVEGDVVHVNIKKFIDNNALKNSAAKLISRDSIALVTRVGVGKVAVINQDFTTSQDFLSLSDFDGNDIKFIAYQLFRLMQENAKVLQGTSIKGISKTDLIEQSIAIPNSIKEQNLIASLLSQTDSIITLHQRKLNNLKLKKKALLQKLFPKNGKRYPELRFPGFTDAWEQRKLSEVTTCFDNLRVPVTASDRVPGKIPYYGANGIQDYVSGHTHSGEFVLIAEDGANDLNDYPIQYVNGAIWVNNHAHVIAGYKEKLENKFLSYSLKTVKMTTFIVGGGRSKLNLKALLEIPISMPNYDEQCVIGKFIETIDINITLHQRKLDHLQLQKKALLQQMFV